VALANAETFFMVSAGQTTDRVRRHIAAVDAAMAVGVERAARLLLLPPCLPGTTCILRSTHAPSAYATRYCAMAST
jgi:hypothetical protein